MARILLLVFVVESVMEVWGFLEANL